jgi:hypothetical protein
MPILSLSCTVLYQLMEAETGGEANVVVEECNSICGS